LKSSGTGILPVATACLTDGEAHLSILDSMRPLIHLPVLMPIRCEHFTVAAATVKCSRIVPFRQIRMAHWKEHAWRFFAIRAKIALVKNIT